MTDPTRTRTPWRFLLPSAIGIFMFFVPVSLDGTRTIPLDHLVTGLRHLAPGASRLAALALLAAGATSPFLTGTWRETHTAMILSILKLLGLFFAALVACRIGPAALMAPEMGPFLLDKLVVPVGLIVPIGAVFLSFLIDYGLLEFVGAFMTPIMRPVFHVPGRAAIDAVASFVGSYSIGLLITDQVYRQGRYSLKEAAIIATGFSTVSATFMLIVARTLHLMPVWNLFFWSTLAVTFTVTAITVRLRPLRSMNNTSTKTEPEHAGGLRTAWHAATEAAGRARPLLLNLASTFSNGVKMGAAILPSIMSIGMIGLLLARYTPVFDWAGTLFAPLAWLLGLPEPLLVGKAAALSISEMFLPVLLVPGAAIVVRFTIGVLSVSSILFFSASIPCILATGIPLRIRHLVLIWLERVILSLALAAPIAHLLAYLHLLS